jgi:hydroxypyruvate isomerase
MTWSLRYAAHLGFRSLDVPLFPASAGSADPLAQIEFAASIGFSGVQDPWFTTRAPPQQDAIAGAIAERGLAAGGVVCGSREEIRTPLWNDDSDKARARLGSALQRAIDGARRLGATQVAVLTGQDPDRPRERQIEIFTDALRRAAVLAEAHGLVLCLEPTNARTLPGMLLAHFDEGCSIVRSVGSRAVRMIFDTAHIQSMDGDLLGRFERERDLIEIVQIANHPGRTEPEVGEINMGAILHAVRASAYAGLVELEHLWSCPCEAVERRGIDWLRSFEASISKSNPGEQR